MTRPPGEPAGRRRYEVHHRTEYSYEQEVSASYGRAYLTPRDCPGQWCRLASVHVDPQPDLLTTSVDHYGNRSTYLELHTPHTVLSVTASSVVDVHRTPPALADLDAWTVASAGAAALGVDPLAARGFLLPSPQVVLGSAVREYAAGTLAPGRPLGEALHDLVSGIHADFAYVAGATSVTTTLAQVLRRRAGVCQDFAHLAVACLRSAGLPARYVSGYLETQPPPGRPRLQGADASHAWASVLLPEFGWVDLDPTNDQFADSRYVVTAWGRDYTDVAPLKGVIFTEGAASELTVAVDVVRVPDPGSDVTGGAPVGVGDGGGPGPGTVG